MSRKAFAASTRDEERKLVLDTITRFPSAAALNFAKSHLKTTALRESAARSAVIICENIVDRDKKSVEKSIDAILDATNDQDLIARANVLRDRAK